MYFLQDLMRKTDMYSISHCSFCYVSVNEIIHYKSKVFDDDMIIFDTKSLVFEGFLSISRLERRSASRYYLFNFVNVFLGSVIAGTVLEQLDTFLKQSANKSHGSWKHRFYHGEPQIQFYFLIGLIYAVVTPLLTLFILVFFALAYVVYRHQVINMYDQEYESSAAFWLDVHGRRIVVALIISQLLLLGLLSTKEAAYSTLFLSIYNITVTYGPYDHQSYIVKKN
ncbi:putative calcium-dependent channel, 7TM region phosphate [Helianthus anomalus]